MKIRRLTKTGKATSDFKALLEVAMATGKAVNVDNDPLKPALRYCLPAICDEDTDFDLVAQEVAEAALNKYRDSGDPRKVVAISFCRFDGMALINIVIDDEQEPTSYADLAGKKEVFAYVYNASYPDMSEFGYSFYENYKRRY